MGQYTNRIFGEYLLAQGIHHQTTCPYTPAQNGVAERKNNHLLEVARSMMISMNVPKQLWGQAILTAAQLINKMPSRVLEWKSPYEMLKGANGGILSLKVFGCVCFVKDNRPSVGKLDPRTLKCVFVGYSATQNSEGICLLEPSREAVVCEHGCTFLRIQAILYTRGVFILW
jgi:streptogramin lyase